MVARLRERVPSCTFFDTAETTAAVRRYEARLASFKAWAQLVRRQKSRIRPSQPIVWLACISRHYVTVVADGLSNHATLHDSARGTIAQARAAALMNAVHELLEQWRPELGPATVTLDVKTPQQAPGSNDCALHALSTAWRRTPSAVPCVSRCDLASGTLPDVAPPVPEVAKRPNASPPVAKDVAHESKGDTLVTRDLATSGETPRTRMSHAEVKKFLKQVAAGTALTFTMALKRGRHGTLRWRGHVARPGGRTPKLPATMQFTAEWCERCSAWHDTAAEPYSATPWEVPDADFEYFEIAPSDGAECAPRCRNDDERGSDYESSDEDEGEGDTTTEPGAAHAAATAGATRTANAAKETDESGDRPAAAPGAGDERPIATLPDGDPRCFRGHYAKSWFIYGSQPPHIHNVVWNHLAPSTRQAHIRWLSRIKAAVDDPSIARAPIAQAAIECVTRLQTTKHWRWSTTASAYSTVASALAALPIYTNHPTGIDIRRDTVFRAAMSRAQKLARLNATNPLKSAPMSREQFDTLCRRVKTPAARVILILSWYMSARPGDVRRLQRREIHLGVPDDKGTPIRARFTAGKGAAFWGPYTVHAYLPTDEAKFLAAYLDSLPRGDCDIATKKAQSILSREVNAIPDHSLRSIRRGSLMWLAACGATDRMLQLASGHRRHDTLMRYLGWGFYSSEATAAARERAALMNDSSPRGGDDAPTVAAARRHPTWMGVHANLVGQSGRRVRKPPRLLPLQPPSAAELGIDGPLGETDTTDWPLHVKDVPLADWDALERMTRTADLRDAVAAARSWIRSPKHYGVTWEPLIPEQIPFARFTTAQVETMVAFGKLKGLPNDAVIHSGAKGHAVPQIAKKRFRPVFEPLYNPCIDKTQLPPVSYPSRLERRQSISKARLFGDIDFAAYYDSHALDPMLHSYHVIRVKTPVMDPTTGQFHTLFALTREPMGATHSAHVAQTFTWALCEPLLHGPLSEKIHVHTVLDNIAIDSDDDDAFAEAWHILLRRCDAANVLINDREALPTTNEGFVKWGRERAKGPTTFLGEVYAGGTVRNTERNVEKLKAAYSRATAACAAGTDAGVTRRQIASLIGLAAWMAHTVGIPLAQHHEVLRLFAALESQCERWDDAAYLSPQALTAIGRLVGPLAANAPSTPVQFRPPSSTNNDYAAIAIVDASATGFGAHIAIDDQVLELRSGWTAAIRHSAWAEPMAARIVHQWVRDEMKRRGIAGRVAMVTDHSALAAGQRRWWSGNGGVSTAYYINAYFAETCAETPSETDTFFVAGHLNPTDAASRANEIGDPLRIRAVSTNFPSLASFSMPVTRPSRPWWNV